MVLGNALHLLVEGVSAADQARLELLMDDLRRLHASVELVRADAMLEAISALPPADRALLADALELCARLADTQAEHLLGAPAETRAAVAAFLRSDAAAGGA